MSIIIAIILALAIGGGVSVAAENARPGNALYGFKVGVNEEVRAAFALGAKADAVWDLRRAERRLEEAESVAAEGELKADARVQIEANFKEHATRVRALIAELSAKGDTHAAADLAANLETSLRAHERILANLSAASTNGEQAELNELGDEVRAEGRASATLKADTESKVEAEASADVQAAAEGRLHAAENKIAEVRAFINAMKDRVSATATASAEAKLAESERLVVDGKAKLEAHAWNEAFITFGRAHEEAQEAKLLLDLGAGLNIEVGSATGSVHSEGRVEINL